MITDKIYIMTIVMMKCPGAKHHGEERVCLEKVHLSSALLFIIDGSQDRNLSGTGSDAEAAESCLLAYSISLAQPAYFLFF